MKETKTTLHTKTIFSDDETKRYLLQKVWDPEKPRMTVIMLAPSEAAGIELDSSTLLVLNNVSRLGYGSVDILNLFATLNDFSLREAEREDAENLKAIISSAKKADCIVYAAGVGKAKNKTFVRRQEQVMEALRAFEDKLYCLCSENGDARLQHPLSPAVRTWCLSPLKVVELLPEKTKATQKSQTK